jgi:hypothetical protein
MNLAKHLRGVFAIRSFYGIPARRARRLEGRPDTGNRGGQSLPGADGEVAAPAPQLQQGGTG